MKFGLNTITYKGITLDKTISFDDKMLKSVGIVELKNIKLDGRVYLNSSDEVILSCTLSGVMVLKDSFDNENIDHPFDIEINEDLISNDEYELEQNKNILDISEILWQNIVLEIPLRIVKDEENKSLKGDGWELNGEDDPIDSRLSPLLDLLKER